MFCDMLCLKLRNVLNFAFFLLDEKGVSCSSLQDNIESYKMSAGCRERRIGSQPANVNLYCTYMI